MNTGFIFSAHRTDTRVDHEVIFAEFDKKCIGLESQTPPLTDVPL